MRYYSRTYFHLRAAFFAALFASPLSAAEQWIKLTTPHFELYTSAGEKKGREAILYFEQVRGFFLEASPSKHVPDFPVRIVAFRGEKQYHPYRLSESAFAYYTRGRSRDYIVMGDIVSEHYPAVIHEYTHLIIEHIGLKFPIWLNEGLAELYSTLKPVGKKASVGEIIPGRAQTLLTSKWIPLDVLTSVDQASPLYNERNRAGMFYAESWLLTHMLFFGPQYRPNFTKFASAVSTGKSMDQAAQAVLGKHLWEVENDARDYMRGRQFYHAVFNIRLEKSAEDPDVAEVSELESGLVLADLLALIHKPQEALEAYQQLAKSNPGRPEVEQSLGYLAWQSGNNLEARRHFARAFDDGSKDPQMCYHYALLQRQAGDAKAALAAFQKAVELKPGYTEARLQLGLLLVDMQQYGEAILQLRQVGKIDPDQAQWFFPALAYAYLQTGDLEKARQNTELARKWAKTPAQIENAASLLRFLDAKQNPPAPARVQVQEGPPRLQHAPPREFAVAEQPPPANPFISKDDKMSHVEGIAQRLDCSAAILRFHVLVGHSNMVFEIPDPDRVVIKHSGELHHNFACGPQKPYKVAVDFAILPDPKNGSAGIVRALEF